MKISGVSGEGLARLLQVIESDEMKIRSLTGKIKVIQPKVKSEGEENEIFPEHFRFAKIQEVRPEESDKNTYLVTLKVFLKVWQEQDLLRLGRDPFLAIFRSLDVRNLPSPDNGKKLEKMMSLLLSLNGKSFPREVCENEQGGGKVIVVENTPLTTATLLEKIFPRLEYIELHAYRRGQDAEVDILADQLFEARDIAKSLN